MDDAAAITVCAHAFIDTDPQQWDQLVEPASWSEVRAALERLARRGLADAGAGAGDSAGAFEESVTLGALATPPTGEEKQRFDARHLTGGLPASALPVESLYPQAQRAGRAAYDGPPAQAMRRLIASLPAAVPPEFRSCPDHLALQLDCLATFLRLGRTDEAVRLIDERLAWLPRYRARLSELDDAAFACAVVDALIGLRAATLRASQ
ncbi:nitrate reductase delta subunit [Berryella wangjianweii]|uniref:Nitrate reductase delta subunit n=1 Tax=Berryella wangjianweii TaxID=2734634 RepID=A0A6M8J264_9ACTN|nr:molecular chaperone TorD family protein [Berryella wangjianweii]QKF07634.1 nitrate reductase delta subunit [Berryella wangjianweii]